MLIQLKDSPSFNYTPDSEIIERYENGMSFNSIITILASCDRITKAAAKQRVCCAVLRSQLSSQPLSDYTTMPTYADPFKYKEV